MVDILKQIPLFLRAYVSIEKQLSKTSRFIVTKSDPECNLMGPNGGLSYSRHGDARHRKSLSAKIA